MKYRQHLRNRKHKGVVTSSSSSSSSFSSSVVTSSSSSTVVTSSSTVSTGKGDWKALLKVPLESIKCEKADGEDGETWNRCKGALKGKVCVSLGHLLTRRITTRTRKRSVKQRYKKEYGPS